MNIFFDYQAFSLQTYGGISRYFCELINGINKTEDNHAHLSQLWSNNVHLKEYGIKTLPYPFKNKYSRVLHKPNQLYNLLDYKTGQYDIYHSTYFDDFLSKPVGDRPFVTTFYDMIYERLSNQFIELSADKFIIPQKKKIAYRSSHLIAISESTKRDMVEILGIEPSRISVIYLGSSFQPESINQTTSDLSVTEQPYLLFVGNRAGYKNFSPFLKAVAHLLKRYSIKLVCGGGGSFTSTEKDVIQELSLQGLVEQRLINDTILPTLYKKALAFVFPSLYEGFGIPVLEAFSCGCPCIISDSSSLPEVAEDAAMYFDPTNVGSIEASVEKIILDNSLRSELVSKGWQQLNKFSWSRTVQETLELYKKLT
ncbi:glycosyltransferase family 4 protein [Spirosoma aerophilum]